MLIYITKDFNDFERGVPVEAGALLDYADEKRALEIIQAGFAHEITVGSQLVATLLM
ncbi:hypothetical protein ACLGL1_09435 [Peptococcus simiae]|uniref:hypothetical protein n=1 Tax=Peptococcus simiae TaxID=1643805 RepID=UPI0039805E2A